MRISFLLLLTALPATAQDAPFLAFPVECVLGETCMIQQLVDHDPGPDARDFLCGAMSYDGHQGTDIRVPDMEALDEGVPILAAADGTVLGTRNMVSDTGADDFPEGQDCGNGVVIAHGDGWQTQYCHMAAGSVLVQQGEAVTEGQVLGSMGFSGNTEFPHLHLTVRRNGDVVDPFAPEGADNCGADASPLWTTPLPVALGGILSVGFSDGIPTYDAIQAGTADAEGLSAIGDAIVLWGFVHGGREGDVMTLTITDPSDEVYHTQTITLDRTQAQLFRASGRRIRDALTPGPYTGTITLGRDGAVIDRETTVIPVR